MADSFGEMLIEVRKRRFLYDVSSKLYRDKLKKELAWEEIANVCGRKGKIEVKFQVQVELYFIAIQYLLYFNFFFSKLV